MQDPLPSFSFPPLQSPAAVRMLSILYLVFMHLLSCAPIIQELQPHQDLVIRRAEGVVEMLRAKLDSCAAGSR